MNTAATVTKLQELLVALDSRHLQPARASEVAIARASSEMRDKALALLAELQADTSADLT